MYKKRDARAKIVVLLIKPTAFVAFPLPSPSSHLKVPNISSRREKAVPLIPARVVSLLGSDALQNSTGATGKGHLISNGNLGRGATP